MYSQKNIIFKTIMVFKNITLTLLTGHTHSIIIVLEDQCIALIGAGRKTRVHQGRGGSPLFLF